MIRKFEIQPESQRESLFTILVDKLRTMVKDLQRLVPNLRQAMHGKRLGPEPASHRKPDIVDWLQFVVTDSDLAQFVFNQMGMLEKSVLGEVVHNPGGELHFAQISAKYGKYPSLHGPGKGDLLGELSQTYKQEFCPLLSIVMAKHHLMAKDVQEVYSHFVPHPSAPDPVYIQSLPKSLPLPSGELITEYTIHATEQSALIDVQTILNLVSQNKIGVSSKTGRVSKSGARIIREALSRGDFYPHDLEASDPYDVQIGTSGIRPFAWPLLLEASNLAQIEGNKLALTRSGRSALKKKPHEVLKILWERWLKTTILHEMNRIETIKGQKSKKKPLYAARSGRESLKNGLTELTPDKWILLQDFFRHLFAQGIEPDIVRNDWALYIIDPEYDSFGYSHIDWDILTGRFARAFLLEYAATLGIIDVVLIPPWGALSDVHHLWGADDLNCLSRYDGLMALRLTNLGAWILGQTNDYSPPKPIKSLHIISEAEIRIIDASQASVVQPMLERFCIQTDTTTFRLDIAQAMQAVEQGLSPSEMQDFLRRGSDQELPGQIQAFFEQVEQRAGIFRIAGQALLVECSDPNILQAVVNDGEIRKLCLPAGDSALVVRKENEETLKVFLHKLGYALPIGA
jgi:hypothetical protein